VIIDTSAILAILFGEPDASRYEEAIALGQPRLMSVATLLEAAMVVESRGGVAAGLEQDRFLKTASIELVPITAEQADSARRAWRRCGKGNHPAGLNFGDCFVYALAQTRREPLLFKGEDFARTDIEAA
jgi:ribonuclease VapC